MVDIAILTLLPLPPCPFELDFRVGVMADVLPLNNAIKKLLKIKNYIYQLKGVLIIN